MQLQATDWVAAAKRAPILNIGQLDKNDIRALDAAVRRGELVKGRAPFAGRMASKTCYAVSQNAIDAKVAREQREFDLARAMDRVQRSQVAA